MGLYIHSFTNSPALPGQPIGVQGSIQQMHKGTAIMAGIAPTIRTNPSTF